MAQLADLDDWAATAGAVPGDDGDDGPARLAGIVGAAVIRHGTHGHAHPVMLVHAATAPNAVLRTLRALPRTLWEPGVAAGWAATAAVTAAYGAAQAKAIPPAGPTTADSAKKADVDEIVSLAVR